MSGDRLLEIGWPVTQAQSGTEQVQLGFAADVSGRTWLRHQRVAYPFHVGRSLAVPGDPAGMATVYIQCCSGGLFENDAVRARIDCGPGAKAHLTTSAATVVHSMEVGEATQTVEIVIGTGGLMEYLPDPTILFPDARLSNRVRVHLGERAVALVGDTVLTHDPGYPRADNAGANSPGVSNLGRQRLRNEIAVQSSSGDLLACDRWEAGGDAGTRLIPGILGPYRCQASFLVLGQELPVSELLDRIRVGLARQFGVYAGASSLPNDCGLVVRLLSADAADVKAGLHAAWDCARRLLLGKEAIGRRK